MDARGAGIRLDSDATGLVSVSLDECLKAEAAMRADWDHVYNTMPHKYQHQTADPGRGRQANDPWHLHPAWAVVTVKLKHVKHGAPLAPADDIE